VPDIRNDETRHRRIGTDQVFAIAPVDHFQQFELLRRETLGKFSRRLRQGLETVDRRRSGGGLRLDSTAGSNQERGKTNPRRADHASAHPVHLTANARNCSIDGGPASRHHGGAFFPFGLNLALHERPVLDRQPGCLQITLDFGAGLEVDARDGCQRPLDLAADDDGGG